MREGGVLVDEDTEIDWIQPLVSFVSNSDLKLIINKEENQGLFWTFR